MQGKGGKTAFPFSVCKKGGVFMPSPIKTNVSRILDSAGVSYKMHTYESHGEALDGQSVAQALGVDPRCLFKTLVTKGHDGEHRVFVVPCTGELDLKAAARAAGCKSVEMIHVKDLQKVTGYIRGGCSPLGMKRPYPTVVDESCKKCETIIVSAGKIGFQVELHPDDLLRLCGGKTAPIAK